jgi:hypothetical protein
MKKFVLPFVFILSLVSCQKNSSLVDEETMSSTDKRMNNPNSKRLKIGDAYAGGIIFYFSDKARKHGLVCASTDQAQLPWDLTLFDPQNANMYNPYFVGATNTAIGTGFLNTSAIISALGQGNYAAYMCRNYTGGGYSDWSLPSKDELNLMYQNLKVSGLALFSASNLSYYWSSSEIDYRAVWSQRFDDGTQVDFAWKNNAMNIRPIRAF